MLNKEAAAKARATPSATVAGAASVSEARATTGLSAGVTKERACELCGCHDDGDRHRLRHRCRRCLAVGVVKFGRASRDAREAVALSIAPRLSLALALDTTVEAGKNVPRGVIAQIDNTSGWPATDVRVEIQYSDGRTVHETRERLGSPELWSLRIPNVDGDGQDGLDDLRRRVKSLVLTYADERRIVRYMNPVDIGSGPPPISGFRQRVG